jgi:hypothetical protein
VADSETKKTITSKQYLQVLEPFAKASQAWEYEIPGRPDLLVYGSGYSGNWPVQTQMKAVAGLAVLASDPAFDAARAGMSREAVLDRALRMLRYALQSHHSGSFHCCDNLTWGHSWISALGIERMMHAVEAIEDHLTDSDRERLRAVLVSESEWLIDGWPVRGGTVENNVPESNAWNGAISLRTAEMYPDEPHAGDFREKGLSFLMNSISVAEDAVCRDIYDGRPVSEWFVGDNFFSSYALNHHRYMNVGYMVVTLSNIAMLHFLYKKLGRPAPQAVYHHVQDLWRLVKSLTFPDGRLARIGGDTRVRYCYCQDYAVPAWLMMADHFGDSDVIPFETGWLDIVGREMAANGDGTYLSQRCAELSQTSQTYYTRLESDRAAALSMGAYWRRVHSIAAEAERSEVDYTEPFAWHDEYHGSCFHRNKRRLASWTWRAAEPPQGLCVPVDASDTAEWRRNLSAQVVGEGANHESFVESHGELMFGGGFVTWGLMRTKSDKALEGGREDDPLALQHIVYAALPDGVTCVLVQFVRAPGNRVILRAAQGLGLQIPNDIFNGCSRVYHTALGSQIVQGFGSPAGVIETGSRWVNMDDKLGVCAVYGTDQIYIARPGRRQIGLRSGARLAVSHGGGMLYADELWGPYLVRMQSADAGSTILDAAFVLQAGVDHDATAAASAKSAQVDTGSDAVRALIVEGRDGITYLLVASFADVECDVALALDRPMIDLVTSERVAGPVTVPAGWARVMRLE